MKINSLHRREWRSAVPMAARVVQKFVSEQTKGKVNLLMAAHGPNVAGVIGTAIAAVSFWPCPIVGFFKGRWTPVALPRAFLKVDDFSQLFHIGS